MTRWHKHEHPVDDYGYCDVCEDYPQTKAQFKRIRKGARRAWRSRVRALWFPWEGRHKRIVQLERELRYALDAERTAAESMAKILTHQPPVIGHDFDLIDRLRRANAQGWSDAEIVALVKQHPAAHNVPTPWPR